MVKGLRAGSSFALVRFESATYCIESPQLVWSAWVKYLSCLFMDIRYVTPLLSGIRLKKGPFVLFHGQAVYSVRSLIRSKPFRNVSPGGSYYWAKNISGKIWFFHNYCPTVYSMFLMTLFSENDDFVREIKIVPRGKIQWKWNKLEESDNTSNAGATACIILKIKENVIAVLKCWNGWMSVLFVQLTKKKKKGSETRYICKFCVAQLHKEECFERYHGFKRY
jgi:hypothetical protein